MTKPSKMNHLKWEYILDLIELFHDDLDDFKHILLTPMPCDAA